MLQKVNVLYRIKYTVHTKIQYIQKYLCTEKIFFMYKNIYVHVIIVDCGLKV